jgi:thioredoxin reductase
VEKENEMTTQDLPVAVIGAGPVGLAAAAHLVSRGETPLVLEAGTTVGASMLEWGHVPLFSPWRYTVDELSAGMLEATGWTRPAQAAYPTGRDLVTRYLAPLAALPQIRPYLRLSTQVLGVSRQGYDRTKTAGRESAPFVLRVRSEGRLMDLAARAVIDASGTFRSPNPLGGSGMAAIGEAEATDRIFYGIPDVRGEHRARYAGRKVLVVGSGHSAFNVLLDLGILAEETGTSVHWVVRRPTLAGLFGGGENDQLPERGRLGLRMQEMVDRGTLTVDTGFRVARVAWSGDEVVLHSDDGRGLPAVHEIVATTGFRPDLQLLRELRLDLDAIVESPSRLAPLIDPNVHSCGTVPPHGAAELQQPERDFYVVGMKSYGRAPTFLLLTGYEQVRSVVCALTGDETGAREVRLVLPETGVCGGAIAAADSCCGTESVPALAAERLQLSPRPVERCC